MKPTGHGGWLWRWCATCAGIERIRRDRVFHEALTARANPLHLALVFGLSRTTVRQYALIACGLLDGQPTGGAEA